jgi:hypothetical protein
VKGQGRGTPLRARSVEARFLLGNGGKMENLIDERDAARLLKLSTATLQAWRARRIGPPFVVLSRKAVRYRVGELEEFVKQREVATDK